MHFLYGKAGNGQVEQSADGSFYVQVDLAPRQFVILE
jgi:hypothetical protein